MKPRSYTFSAFLSAFILCILMLMPLMAQADNLISILVADTKDDFIGGSVQKDFANMQSKMTEIAKYTKMKEIKIHLNENDATPQRLNRILGELTVNKDDVIVFFYAGHGFHPRSQKNTTPWPNMIFSSGGKSVSYDSVIRNLEQKKPRLLLTIADTCNMLSGDRDGSECTRAPTSAKKDSFVLEHNYKLLFLETTGTIKIASSSVGESAWGGKSGGIFTNAFLSKMDRAVQSQNGIDWQVILEESARKTSLDTAKKNSTQHPYYEIKVRN